MTAPASFESRLLARPQRLLREAAGGLNDGKEAKFQILEAVASLLGRFDLAHFHQVFGVRRVTAIVQLLDVAQRIADSLRDVPIHPSLALSALAREEIDPAVQRATGAYYTDFRLAQQLGAAAEDLPDNARIIDPASGSGILLVAATLATCGDDRYRTRNWLANSVFAADLSPTALRGAMIALASLTDSVDVIQAMRLKWQCSDSLMTDLSRWQAMAPDGFDLVIGNPPWEKLRLTRHEHLKAAGAERHYGAGYEAFDLEGYTSARAGIDAYARRLVADYPLLDGIDPDLYMAFLELFFRLVKPGGYAAVLVPAGLIRSQGTERFRHYLLDSSEDISITVLENRARFFTIDTRFKFLAVTCQSQQRAGVSHAPVRLLHARGNDAGIERYGAASIERNILRRVRPDLSIPEVRNEDEWRIFLAMCRNGIEWNANDSPWRPDILREVDMTNGRKHFRPHSGNGLLPLTEGRMVHQHRFGVKAWQSGTGRSARWRTLAPGESQIAPQFWLSRQVLTAKAQARVDRKRVGFCDITGQTNERSMLAALVPPGVICGNKVPTILFPNDPSDDRLFLWLAVANSIPFDWMLRRVVTTTINYFLLLGLPMPDIDKDSPIGQRLISAARQLADMDGKEAGADELATIASLRADIDALVLKAYGLGFEDLRMILRDFPLLDRGQPPLAGETRSTITRDTLLLGAARELGRQLPDLADRVRLANKSGAIAYLPAEFARRERE